MAPQSHPTTATEETETLPRTETESLQPTETESSPKKTEYKTEIIWKNVFFFLYLHIAALYGLKLFLFDAKWLSSIWAIYSYYIAGTGITGGAHRLWSHRSYTANVPLRIYLALCHCMALQKDLYDWCRDHRVHHKFTETDADPHNAKRGFFFSHMGWLMCKKHPDVKEKGKTVDLSDVLADPVVAFQMKHYLWLGPLFSIYLPVALAHYGWGETWWNSFFVCFVFRYVWTLHCTWSVNSVAHLFGDKPYDKDINPVESLTSVLMSGGEGYHNYHHTFPWDYRASEWGWKWNICTFLIDLWASLGWAHNRKKVSQEIIDRRRQLKGDGTPIWFPGIHQRNKSK